MIMMGLVILPKPAKGFFQGIANESYLLVSEKWKQLQAIFCELRTHLFTVC